jgi:hypothetical protein
MLRNGLAIEKESVFIAYRCPDNKIQNPEAESVSLFLWRAKSLSSGLDSPRHDDGQQIWRRP